jgi:hypothetical protein
MVQLTSDEFRRFVDLTARDPDLQNVRDRARLLSGALEGSLRAGDGLSRRDFDSPPLGGAANVVQRLAHVGRVKAEKNASGVFLKTLPSFKGREHRASALLPGLMESTQLDGPVVSEADMSRSRGHEALAGIQVRPAGADTP